MHVVGLIPALRQKQAKVPALSQCSESKGWGNPYDKN
jgi:hypothetical protein